MFVCLAAAGNYRTFALPKRTEGRDKLPRSGGTAVQRVHLKLYMCLRPQVIINLIFEVRGCGGESPGQIAQSSTQRSPSA